MVSRHQLAKYIAIYLLFVYTHLYDIDMYIARAWEDPGAFHSSRMSPPQRPAPQLRSGARLAWRRRPPANISAIASLACSGVISALGICRSRMGNRTRTRMITSQFGLEPLPSCWAWSSTTGDPFTPKALFPAKPLSPSPAKMRAKLQAPGP